MYDNYALCSMLRKSAQNIRIDKSVSVFAGWVMFTWVYTTQEKERYTINVPCNIQYILLIFY